MPIYEYGCECGAVFEALERIGATRERCGELCRSAAAAAARVAPGEGRVERVFSTGIIRGDGRETQAPVFDPCKRSGRPGGGCE